MQTKTKQEMNTNIKEWMLFKHVKRSRIVSLNNIHLKSKN